MKELKAVIAGFGGQGILFAGKVLTYCGMIEEKYLTWMPSYGPEMRGGTCNCSVTISDRMIGSPLVLDPDVLIVMNQPSFDKFIDTVQPGGIVLADSGMCPNIREREGVRIFAIPATSLAEEAGVPGLGNIVLVGKLLKELEFCDIDTLKAAIKKCCPATRPEMYEYNLQALKIGRNA